MVDNKELGNRLKMARERNNLTQEAVASKIKVNRSVISLIESGQREITSIELNKLADIYGRDIRDFLKPEFKAEDNFIVLFRAVLPPAETGQNQGQINQNYEILKTVIAIAHEKNNLEEILGLRSVDINYYTNDNLMVKDKLDAIKQAECKASLERRTLQIGDLPIENIVKLLESQNIIAIEVELDNDISGFTINKPDSCPVIVVNKRHAYFRQRFSYAHEYAHVIFDRSLSSLISKDSERANLLEVRANAFAAAFLMPAEGIRNKLVRLGKDGSARNKTDIYNENSVYSIETRSNASINELQLYHIVELASFYGVSRQALLYRLKSLRLISQMQFEKLKQDEEQNGKKIAHFLNSEESQVTAKNNFMSYFIDLALEAFRLDEISKSKFIELVNLAGISNEEEALSLASASGIIID